MVFEYLDHDLAGILDYCSKQNTPLPPAQIKHYMQRILTALADCHARGALHRDVKCALGRRARSTAVWLTPVLRQPPTC
jgi:serine/threonine protein kinase